MNQRECQLETLKHISNVRKYINKFTKELKSRGKLHDSSKLENPELDIFTKYTPKLATCTYGSDEYQGFLDGMKKGLDHHYMVNRHHPEHFINGINDMTLVDLVEMFCDWKAATLRHDNGDLLQSILFNARRFEYDNQLKNILFNTAKSFYKYVLEYSCVDGRKDFYCADTKEKLYHNIDVDIEIDKEWKDIFKYGYSKEFKDKELNDWETTIDNGLWVKLTVNSL